jgi:hypothetical protein
MEIKLSQWDFITSDYWHTKEEDKFSNAEINDLLQLLDKYHNPANDNITWR